MTDKNTPFLDIQNLYANYGSVKILKNINIHINRNEVVALIGSNGAGKTTLMNTISNIKNLDMGKILYQQKDITSYYPRRRALMGIAHVPEGRMIFSSLSVSDNLLLGAYTNKDQHITKMNFDFVYEKFPILYEKRNTLAGTLSGGQQQMLALSRALMSNPKLLLLDEPSMGLAPVVIEEIFCFIEELKKTHLTIFLVEQNSNFALNISDRAYVIENGSIVLDGLSNELKSKPKLREAYLGL